METTKFTLSEARAAITILVKLYSNSRTYATALGKLLSNQITTEHNETVKTQASLQFTKLTNDLVKDNMASITTTCKTREDGETMGK